MRCGARCTLVGAAVILAGIAGLNSSSTDGAEGAVVGQSEFKSLVDQDRKSIESLVEMGKKGGTANISKATRGIKSSSMMIAAYAQSRIGTMGADDGQLATLRDNALKTAAAAVGKNWADVAKLAKSLTVDAPADPKGNKAKVNLVAEANKLIAAVKKDADFDIDDLMFQFKKTDVGGLGIEKEIKDQAKKTTATPATATTIAQRALIVAEFCVDVNPKFEGKKTKEKWLADNKTMTEAAQGLLAAAGDKKKLQAAFDKVDAACVNCHNTFK